MPTSIHEPKHLKPGCVGPAESVRISASDGGDLLQEPAQPLRVTQWREGYQMKQLDIDVSPPASAPMIQ